MQMRIFTQNNSWQHETFLKKMKNGENLNIEFLSEFIKMWPFENISITTWSKILQFLRQRLLFIRNIYFVSSIQVKKMADEDLNELNCITDFLIVLLENSSGRSNFSIGEAIFDYICCVDFDIFYKICWLIKVIIQRRQRNVIIQNENEKISHLYDLLTSEKSKTYTIMNEIVNFEEESIFSINKRLIEKKVDVQEYTRLLFMYLYYENGDKILNIKYLLASIIIYRRPLHNFSSIQIKKMLNIGFERLKNEIDEFEKINIFELLSVSIERKYKRKIIFDKLRIKIQGGIFNSELKNILSSGKRYMESYFKFVIVCINVKSDSLNFIIELGIIHTLKEILNIINKDSNDKFLVTKCFILKVFTQILNNHSFTKNLTLLAENLFPTLYNELEKTLNIIPSGSYYQKTLENVFYGDKEHYIARRYLRILLRFFEDFYVYNSERYRIADNPDLIDTELFPILTNILSNYKNHCYKSLCYVIHIFIIYINTYPLNIVVLEEKNVLPIIFGIYEDIPPCSTFIIFLIDIIGGLCLKKEISNLVIQNKLIESILRTILDTKYINCYKNNIAPSEIGTVLEELVRHHPIFQEVIYNDCITMLKELINPEKQTELYNEEIFLKVIKVYNKDEKEDNTIHAYDIYIEKIRNIMTIINNLFISDCYNENSTGNIFAVIYDLILCSCIAYDVDDVVLDLFKNFVLQNTKHISKSDFLTKTTLAIRTIIARFTKIDVLAFINLLIKIENVISNLCMKIKKDTTKLKDKIFTILGDKKEQFIQFILDISIFSKLLSLQKDIGLKSVQISKIKPNFESVITAFEFFHALYRIYTANTNKVFLKYSRYLEFASVHNDLSHQSISTFMGTNIGLKIYDLHILSLSLLRDIWDEIIELEITEIKKFTNRVFSNLRILTNNEIGPNEDYLNFNDSDNLKKDIKLIKSLDYFVESKKFYISSIIEKSNRKEGLSVKTDNNIYGERTIEVLDHIINAFYIVNFFDSIFDSTTAMFLDSNIKYLCDFTLLIIHELEKMYSHNLNSKSYIETEIDEAFKSDGYTKTIIDKNVFYLNNFDEVIFLMHHTLFLYLKQLERVVDDFYVFASEDDIKNIIEIVKKTTRICNNKEINSIVQSIFKWFVGNEQVLEINLDNKITTEDKSVLSETDVLYLDSLLKTGLLNKYYKPTEKSQIEYLLYKKGYSLVNILQNETKSVFYTVLDNNEYLLRHFNEDKNESGLKLKDLLFNNMIFYIFTKSCDCRSLFGSEFSPKQTVSPNKKGKMMTNVCSMHYDNKFYQFYINLIDFKNTDEVDLYTNLKFIIAFIKISEIGIFLNKTEIYKMIRWKELFHLIPADSGFKLNTLINSIVFGFFEDKAYVKNIMIKIIKNSVNHIYDLNALYYRNKIIFDEIDPIKCEITEYNPELNEDQKDLFRNLLFNVFVSKNSCLLIQIAAELMVYFPALSYEKVVKPFILKCFEKYILNANKETSKDVTKQEQWLSNFLAVLIIRTENTVIKNYIIDLIVTNIKNSDEKCIAAMCLLMSNLLNSKIITDGYPCNSECCSPEKNKSDVSIAQPSRSVSSVISQMRNNRRRFYQSQNTITYINDHRSNEFPNNLSHRIDLLAERLQDMEEGRIHEIDATEIYKSTNVTEPCKRDNYPIIELLKKKKIINLVLKTNMTEITRKPIIKFLDIYCTYKNQGDEKLLVVDDSSSSEQDENFSSTSSSTSSNYSEESIFIDENDCIIYNPDDSSTNTTELSSLDQKSTNTFDESSFFGLKERWLGEYRIFTVDKKSNILFADQNIRIKSIFSQITTDNQLDKSSEIQNGNVIDSQANLEASIREGLIAEQEICTFQQDCKCLDCIEMESSEPTMGDYDGEFPDLDPNVLNELPDDILKEIIADYYEDKRRRSSTYLPINAAFFLQLNNNVREIFEDFELAYQEDFRIDSSDSSENSDSANIIIRDKPSIIEFNHIDHVINLVLSDYSDKTAINIINHICSNKKIRHEFIKKILTLYTSSCQEIRAGINVEIEKKKLHDLLKFIDLLIIQHEDYIVCFSLRDLNMFYDSIDLLEYENHFHLFRNFSTIPSDCEVIKRVLKNTSGVNVEFTDDIKLFTHEIYDKTKDDEHNEVSLCLPASNQSLKSCKDVLIMNIVNSNIAFVLSKYVNINKWLGILKNTTNADFLEHFSLITSSDDMYYTKQYITHFFEDILEILESININEDNYDLMNKINFNLIVLSRMKLNLSNQPDNGPMYMNEVGNPNSSSNETTPARFVINVSSYYLECNNIFNEYRKKVEKSDFWINFFELVKKTDSKEHLITHIQVFEAFCLLAKLRFFEHDYLKIINGDEEVDKDLRLKTTNITNSTKDITEIDGKRLKIDPSYIEPVTPSKNEFSYFNSLFKSKVQEFKEILNILFESHVNDYENSYDILLYFNVLNFDNKRYFIKNLFTKENKFSVIEMNIDRKRLFHDSFDQIISKSAEEFAYSRLNIKFVNEEGVDAGGLSREFFNILSKEIINPNYCLFNLNSDQRTYSISKSSSIDADHLIFFRFVGRVIAKGIIDNFLTDIHFTMPFYKQILGIKLTLEDLESVEPDFYKSFIWMKNNSIANILELRFSEDLEEFGTFKIYDLIPNGRNILVTDENKDRYIELMAEFLMTRGCERQIASFKKGFYEILNYKHVKIFNEKELELLICGLPEIDVDDWRNNTIYYGYKNTDRVIEWFWRCVRNMNNEDRARLLQFVTGTSKLPIEGFKGLQGSDGRQKFQIHTGGKGLPCAHTCFNQLDLPEYKTYEELSEYILYAIRECNTGFGMV